MLKNKNLVKSSSLSPCCSWALMEAGGLLVSDSGLQWAEEEGDSQISTHADTPAPDVGPPPVFLPPTQTFSCPMPFSLWMELPFPHPSLPRKKIPFTIPIPTHITFLFPLPPLLSSGKWHDIEFRTYQAGNEWKKNHFFHVHRFYYISLPHSLSLSLRCLFHPSFNEISLSSLTRDGSDITGILSALCMRGSMDLRRSF